MQQQSRTASTCTLTSKAACSYDVLMNDPRTLRLLDLSPHDTVEVQCEHTLVFDLQYRFRCSHCGRRDGFGISLRDERDRGDNTKCECRSVIVPGREWRKDP
jgi:hypothetical protein